MSDARTIAAPDLMAALRTHAVDQLWNVLTDEYFTGEMIPGSRRVPLEQVGREAASFPKDAAIVVYCSGPSCSFSRLAAEKLVALGFTQVRAFEGGLEAWKQAGGRLSHQLVQRAA